MEGDRLKQVKVRYKPKDLRDLGYDALFEGIERFTVISMLALMPQKTSLLVMIEWKKGPDMRWLEESHLIDQIYHLGRAKGGDLYLLMGSEEPWFFEMIRMIMEEYRVFFDLPVVLTKDSIEVRFVGFLGNISKVIELSKSINPDHAILSIADYDPDRSDRFDRLTVGQYDHLMEAYEKGFFEDERKVTLTDLAKGRKVSPASYMKTLRRAIRNLIRGSKD